MRRLLLLLLLVAAPLHAQIIKVTIDATDAPRKIFHAHLTIPATPGPMRLAYAKWIPGEHGPTGPVVDVVNLRITAGGQPVTWRRDPLDMFVFLVDAPPGAPALEVDFSYLAPIEGGNFTAGPSATANLAVLSWNTLLLFPPGKPGDEVMVEGSIRMPAGWTSASALLPNSEAAGRIDYKPASLTTYIDSPVILGRYLNEVTIPAGTAPPHRIDIVADSRSATETWPTFPQDYGRLVAEAGALFGAYPFRKYDWLVTLSDHVAHFGLEHHESSDNRMPEGTLASEMLRRGLGGLLSHEYVHSWNGKYRRPAIMLSPDYQKPVEGNLLWVYEGLTQYLGGVLAARAGLWPDEYYRENVAVIAAGFDQQPGRTWRPLEDTATSAQILFGSADAWRSLRRGADFYDESVLLWLEVDSLIRQKTNGRASLDDFCRRFHGGSGGAPAVKPYTFDEVVATLNAVAPHDWAAHLRERLGSVSPRAPIAGITNHGWRIVYNDTPNQVIAANEERRKISDYTFSLGFVLKEDGAVRDVILGLPAANAGVGPGMKLIAVNGRRWTRELLDTAIEERGPLELLMENGEFFRTYTVDYRGGPRYPHLARDDARADTLASVISPRASRPR
ncbi:MAG TPA: M61 family peptidase [Thermoanaerobaculia bacterium]|nr:M61 family peptidase [Thermoanaerobaculia bacterium]